MTRTEWEQQAARNREKADAARDAGDEENATFYERKARAAESMVPYSTDGDADERAQQQ